MTNDCTLIYNISDGFAWVRYGDLNGDNPRPSEGDLDSQDNPNARFPTLHDAYIAAARRGHRPTHWLRYPSAVRLRLDHADHWLRMAGLS